MDGYNLVLTNTKLNSFQFQFVHYDVLWKQENDKKRKKKSKRIFGSVGRSQII